MKLLNHRLLSLTLGLITTLAVVVPAPAGARGGFGGGGRGGGGRSFGGGGDRFGGGGDRFGGGGGRSFGGGGGGDRSAGANHGDNFAGRQSGFNRDFDNMDRTGGSSWGGAGSHGGTWANTGAHPATAPLAQNYHLPTNAGFGNIASTRNYMPSGNATHPVNAGAFSNQSSAVRNSFNNDSVQRNVYNNNHFNNVNGDHWNNHNWNNNNWNNGWHNGWWGYPGAWYAPGWGAATAWTALGFGTLAAFEGLSGLSQPVAADYGTSIVYNNDQVYVNSQPDCSAGQYYQQAQELAQAGQAVANPDASFTIDPSPQEQWKPLGVFSLVQGGQTQSTMLMQLAINQAGIVKGNYFNQLTNESDVINGSLDKNTQRIAWSIGNNTGTVFDTTLGNLCKDDSQILVHYSGGNTEQLGLVRLPPPPANQPNPAPGAASPPMS